MLVLKKFEIENFLSFKDVHEFQYDQKGLKLIMGFNYDNYIEGSISKNKHSVGSGKSTFCMIPQFAFFGHLNKNINKDDVVNKVTGKNAKVVLYFSIHDVDYKIERYRLHSKYRNDVYLFEKSGDQWHDISSSDLRATQKTINNLIIFTNDTFNKSVLLSRDDQDQFLEFGPPDRGRMFESIIHLSKFNNYNKKIINDLKIKEDVHSEIYNEIEILKSQNEIYNKHILEDTTLLTTKTNKINNAIDKIKKEINEFSKTSDPKVIEKVNKAYNFYIQLKQKINAKNSISKDIDLNNNNVDSIDDKIIKSNKKITTYETQLKKIKPIKCYNCNAIQDEESFLQHKTELKNKIKDTKNKIKKYESETIKIKQTLNDLQIDYNGIKQDIVDLKEEIKELNIDETILSQIKNDVKLNKLNSVVDQLNKLQNNLIIKETELNSISWDNIKKFKSEIEKNEIVIKKNRESFNEIKEEIKMLEYIIEILDLKNEHSIKQYIIGRILPVFNNILQQNLNKLYNGNLSLNFDYFFNDEITYNNKKYTYHELSTGEKVKLNLAINLSIFDMTKINLNGSSVIFMDEIFSNVDEPTKKATLELINEKYAQDCCVYIISHDTLVQEYFNNEYISIIKEDGNSRIETSVV